MRVKVTTPFFGRKEARLFRVGQVITVTKDRGERMIARGLVVVASPGPKKAGKPAENKAQRAKEDKAEQ